MHQGSHWRQHTNALMRRGEQEYFPLLLNLYQMFLMSPQSITETTVSKRHLWVVFLPLETHAHMEQGHWGPVFQMIARGSKTLATQITTLTAHISSRLSTTAHSWVTDGQRSLLTCLFNFTVPHNSCHNYTCKPRSSESSLKPGCAFPLYRSYVSSHPSRWQVNSSVASFCWQIEEWPARLFA